MRCLRRFADLRKTRPWNFGACTFCVLSIFVTFSLVCPISMPAALRRPQKKHAPGILEHVPCVFCRFLVFLFNLNTILLALGSPSRVRLCGCPVCHSHSHTNFSVPPLLPSVISGSPSLFPAFPKAHELERQRQSTSFYLFTDV